MRVVLADDSLILREGLARLLAKHDDMRLVGEASDGTELVRLARDTLADVVLLDISMPGPGFATVIRILRKERPRLPILVLSGQPASQYAVRVLRAGASGYVSKESLSKELAHAIREAAAGRRYISPGVAESLVDVVTDETERPAHESLSDREFDVLRYTTMGKPVKQIAQEHGPAALGRRIDTRPTPTTHLSVLAFATLSGLRLDNRLASVLGKHCAALTRL